MLFTKTETMVSILSFLNKKLSMLIKCGHHQFDNLKHHWTHSSSKKKKKQAQVQ